MFSDNISRVYIEKYLNEEIREEIRTLCQDAADNYYEMLDDVEWLSEETRKEEDFDAFMGRADKLIAYYDSVVAFDDGTPYRGQMVQAEAIADMAGFKCMLKMAEKIDDFDYDKFFRANAYLWAKAGTLSALESQALTDSHPLNYLRCNVTAQQYDEFYETYGIKEGDGMYIAPKDRIAVW